MELMDDYSLNLSEKEYAILSDLYDYRVMTTNQIKKKHFNNRGTYVNKVLWKMRKEKLIKTTVLKNSRRGKKGYSYHRVSETGLKYLTRYGKSVEVQSTPYYRPKQIPYILMVNDLVVEFADTDWEIWDSRKVKKEYNLDKRMNIQGLVISPEGKRYGLYVLDKNAEPKTIGKIHSEIRANANNKLQDYLILAKGMNSYKEFINRAIEPPEQEGNYQNLKRLYTGNAIKVYLFNTFVEKAKTFDSEINWIKKLCNYYGFKLKSIGAVDGERQSFPIVIEYGGNEMYFVDVTDSDLNKISDIEVYSRSLSSRRWENRNVLALSLSIQTKANLMLDNLSAVQHGLIDGETFTTIARGNN